MIVGVANTLAEDRLLERVGRQRDRNESGENRGDVCEAARRCSGRATGDGSVAESIWRSGCDVRKQVVEEGIVGDLIAAADDRRAVSNTVVAPMRIVGETNAGAEVVVVRIDLCGGGDVVVGEADECGGFKDIRGLAKVFVSQTVGEREIRRGFVGVLSVEGVGEQIGTVPAPAAVGTEGKVVLLFSE